MADWQSTVSKVEIMLQDALDHPDDYDIALQTVATLNAHCRSIDCALLTLSAESSQQHTSAINVLVRFAGTLGRFFKFASMRDKGGDMYGKPPHLTATTFDLTALFSNVLVTINKCGSASIRKYIFKQVRTMLSNFEMCAIAPSEALHHSVGL